VRNLAGPLVEGALDPSYYLGGFGALTSGAGKAAQAAGRMPARILRPGFLEAVARGERTLGYGLTGPGAARVAESGLEGLSALNRQLRRVPGVAGAEDVASKFMTREVIPRTRSLFSAEHGFSAIPEIQEHYYGTKTPMLKALTPEVLAGHAKLAGLEGDLTKAGLDLEGLRRYQTSQIEGVAPEWLGPREAEFAATIPQELRPHVQAYVDEAGRLNRWYRSIESGAALNPARLQDPYIDYLMRRREGTAGAGGRDRLGRQQLLPTTHPSLQGRSDILTGLPGGTLQLEDLLHTYGGRGLKDYQVLPQLHDVVRGRLGYPLGHAFDIDPLSAEGQWAQGLASFISKVPRAELFGQAGETIPYFISDPSRMVALRGMQAVQAASSAHTITDVLGDVARHAATLSPEELASHVPLTQVLQGQLDNPIAREAVATKLGIDPQAILDRMQQADLAPDAMKLPTTGVGPPQVPLPPELGPYAGRAPAPTSILGEIPVRAPSRAQPRPLSSLAPELLEQRRGPLTPLESAGPGIGMSSLGPGTLTRGDIAAAAEGAYREPAAMSILGERQPGIVPPGPTAPTSVLDALPPTPSGAAAAGPDLRDRAIKALLGEHHVPSNVAADLTKLLARGTQPHEVQAFLDFLSKSQSMTRRGLYSMWPGSHVKNDMSGVYSNATEHGMSPTNPNYFHALEILHNPASPRPTGIPGVPTGRDLLTEAYAHGVIGAPAGELGIETPRFSTNPLEPRPGLRQIAGKTAEQLRTGPWQNPFGEQGALVQMGDKLNKWVENKNRLALYMHLRQQGFIPQAAADAVFQTHFNYETGLSDFEKKYLPAFALFPTFSRFNVPKHIGLAVENPRALAAMRLQGAQTPDESTYIPQYLRQGLALPLPSTDLPTGQQRFLTSLGLPFEEAFGHFPLGGGPLATAQKTAQSALGMLRPDLQAFLEWAFNTQAHTGRKLTDLEPGAIAGLGGYAGKDTATVLAQLSKALPTGRLVSTLDRLLDQRKWTAPGAISNLLSLTTGTRTSDVDLEKLKASDIHKILEERMGRSRAIREAPNYFIPEERLPYATEEDVQNIRLSKILQKQAKARKKQRQLEGE
jgi:hypothetical protein